jgi:hypothetical protein
VLSDANYVLGGGADTQVAVGAFLEVLLAIANIATAVVLFPILRRQSEAIALGYVALRIVESTLIVVGLISLLSVVMLREDVAGAGADNAACPSPPRRWSRSMTGRFCLGRSSVLAWAWAVAGLGPHRSSSRIRGPLCRPDVWADDGG